VPTGAVFRWARRSKDIELGSIQLGFELTTLERGAGGRVDERGVHRALDSQENLMQEHLMTVPCTHLFQKRPAVVEKTIEDVSVDRHRFGQPARLLSPAQLDRFDRSAASISSSTVFG